MPADDVLTLRSHADAERVALRAFNEFVQVWNGKLPASAVIEHVGGTAVPGCLTKGDLDICIRVDRPDFEIAETQLAQSLERNLGSIRTEDFSAFMDDEHRPPLGVQLVTKGSELDFFVRFRDRLRESASLLSSYNDLKRRFSGRDMEEYRRAKADFIGRTVSRKS